MTTPTGYDPITLNHWLWFKHQCHEGTATDFQRLFENIMKRARPEFMQIRPYGNIGDRKCDGLLHAAGTSTVFQVYSPDELKQAEVQAKIEEDLAGAVQHWGATLKTWVFVHNARRGLPPDIGATLLSQAALFPSVTLEHMGNDGLWEVARGLTLQQRSEVLGAPAGYEYLFLTTDAPAHSQQHLDGAHFVLVQDLLSPISLEAVSQALKPGKPFGAPIFIRPTVTDLPWTLAAREQQTMLHEVLSKSRNLLPRFAVFSLAPIPLIVHLGFVLSDRLEVRCFQFDRRNSWAWSPEKEETADANIEVSGLPAEYSEDPVEVTIAVSLSASVARADVTEAAPGASVHVELRVAEPNLMWLQSPRQLTALAEAMRHVLGRLRSTLPGCTRMHLFYAGPTGGAVAIGQQFNPRMNPPLELYQYSRQTKPAYRPALTLTEELS